MIKDENGKISLMRVASIFACLIGGYISVCGSIGFFNSLEGHSTLIISGTSLIAAAIGGKAWQKTSEIKRTGK